MTRSTCIVVPPLGSTGGTPRRVLLVCVIAAVSALGLSAYLAVLAYRGGVAMGCGPGSGCGTVLSSAWSRWLGLPVGVLAAGVYGIAAGAVLGVWRTRSAAARRFAWMVLLAAVTAAIGAAVWFLYLMRVKIEATCAYCTVTHVVGIATAAIAAAAWIRSRHELHTPGPMGAAASVAVGLAAVGILISGQVLLPAQSYQVHAMAAAPLPDGLDVPGSHGDHDHGVAASGGVMSQGAAPSAIPYDSGTGPDRSVTPTLTTVNLSVAELPVLGSRDAKHMLVFLGDYLCPECQELHRMLLSVLDQYQGQLGVIFMPFPLNPKCNSWFKGRGEMPKRFARSCEMARLALGIHRADPQAFAEWDVWVASFGGTVPLSEALDRAVEKVGREALEQALSDPWIDQQIERSAALFRALPEGVKTVPLLLLEGHYVSGLPDRLETLYKIIEDRLGIEPTDHLKNLLTSNEAQ